MKNKKFINHSRFSKAFYCISRAMTEKSNEVKTTPEETVTGNAAPASMLGDGARSSCCAVTAVTDRSAAKKRATAKALQMLTCAIPV